MSRGEGGGEEGVEQDDGLVKVPDEDAVDLHGEKNKNRPCSMTCGNDMIFEF